MGDPRNRRNDSRKLRGFDARRRGIKRLIYSADDDVRSETYRGNTGRSDLARARGRAFSAVRVFPRLSSPRPSARRFFHATSSIIT